MDVSARNTYLALAADLRRAGFKVENYLEPAKLDKQLRYADKTGYRIALLIGSDELAQGTVVVKDLERKEQKNVQRSELIHHLRLALGT